VLGWFGAIVLMIGFVISLWNTAWADPLGALVRGGFMVPVGAGIMAAAVMNRLLETGRTSVNRVALGQNGRQMGECLHRLIRRPSQTQTLEWIQGATGWDEALLLRLLAELRDSGELVEELDHDTGHFYYYMIDRATLNLDSRLENLR
jgi:hypothetical protein